MSEKSPFSKLIGSSLAHIQSLADDVSHYGFRKLKQLGKDKNKAVDPTSVDNESSESQAGVRSEAMGLVKGIARFLGDSGETYYDTYEKIKAKKAQRAQKKEYREERIETQE